MGETTDKPSAMDLAWWDVPDQVRERVRAHEDTIARLTRERDGLLETLGEVQHALTVRANDAERRGYERGVEAACAVIDEIARQKARHMRATRAWSVDLSEAAVRISELLDSAEGRGEEE